MSGNQELGKIVRLFTESYKTGLYRKAAKVAHHGAELARAIGDTYSRIHFLSWEGASLRKVGDYSAARIPLLEAAQPSLESNPEDSIKALSNLIYIALASRPADECRQLISQGRDYITSIKKDAWHGMFYLLEGELEYSRGNYSKAYGLFSAAWEAGKNISRAKGYTEASHLEKLVKTAFSLRDFPALERRQSQLEETKNILEHDNMAKKAGRLILTRAKRTGDRVISFIETATPLSLELLQLCEAVEDRDSNWNQIALRTLTVAGHWPAVEDWLERLHWNGNKFHDQLFLGDERLCRARHALGLPARDDEWDEVFETPSRDAPNREETLDRLAEARARFEGIRAKATAEDRRLETTWYCDTLDQRLARVAALEGPLK